MGRNDGDAGGEYSLDPEDQLQAEDTLVDRGVDDVLDEGYSPPERPWGIHGAADLEEHDSLDDRLRREEPDSSADAVDDEGESIFEGTAGDRRAGRLVAPAQDTDSELQRVLSAEDVGIDGGAASAEEAAMHVVDPDGVTRW